MNKEQFYKDPGTPEQSDFRHKLINEFRESLSGKYDVPQNADGLVVLSAPPSLQFKEDRELREKNPENISRIDFAFDIWKQMIAKKMGKTLEALTEEDLRESAVPPFVLNGETEQIEPMKEIAIALGVPEEKIILIDCGKRGIGNTKTQFLEMTNDPRWAHAKKLAFISTSYHVPRVMRTADANLPKEMDFDVIGVPFEDFSYDIQSKIRGEAKRIIKYSAKGDISKFPRL